MPEWWTYSLEDFLLFSPRVYWRLFELHNAAVWPLQILALLLGGAILAWLVRPRPWSDRVVSAILAVVWIWVAWSFLWHRYATINWAAAYAVPAFVLEALLIGWAGGLRGRLRFSHPGTRAGAVGSAIFLYALVLHPLVPELAGRPFEAAEVFGIAPDPTVMATVGLLCTASGRLFWGLLVLPLAWCLVSWATLYTLGAPEAWILLAVPLLACASRVRC